VFAVEHVIRRERLDLPLPGDVRVAKHDGNVEIVALNVVTNFLSRAILKRL